MATKKVRPARGLKGLVGGTAYFSVGVRDKRGCERRLYISPFVVCGVPFKDEDCFFVRIKLRNRNSGKIQSLEMCLDIMGVIGDLDLTFSRVYQYNNKNLKVLGELVAKNDIAGYQKMIGVDIFD